MKYSNLFAPTLREVPADAEVPSHILLLRAGFVRQLASGIYSYFPLAWKTLTKIINIIREEMEKIGAQEFLLPAIHPAEIWKESGRWEIMGDNMFRLKDRWERDMCLGMTHEEIFAHIASKELKSYKELPQIWYQIQTKFRDEPRPKSGLLRVRQFIMKDSYSFDIDWDGLSKNYEKHYEAYQRIFKRCGLKFLIVEAHSGSMGGSFSHEFMVESDAGEDLVAKCSNCKYCANLEKATSIIEEIVDSEPESDEPIKVHTPGKKSIAEIEEFLKVPARNQIKTLIYIVESEPIIILLRGDHQLNEAKLETVLKTGTFRPATEEEIREIMGANAGSLGPVGVKNIRIIADLALKGRKNMTTGANETDYHIQGVTPEKHFNAEYYDLRNVEEGDLCPKCKSQLKLVKTIEIGHIFKLGTKYSEAMGAYVLDKDGKKVPIVMGSYGIGVERIMTSAIELYHDKYGIIFPITIAPFEVAIVPVSNKDEKQMEISEELYNKLKNMGIDVLLDDRSERIGVKLNDIDLIGIPIKIVIGPKKIKEGKVEVVLRDGSERFDVEIEDAVEKVTFKIEELKKKIENS